MTQDPGGRHSGIRCSVFLRQLTDYVIELPEFRIPQKNTGKEAVLERRPGLDRDLVFPAEIQDTAVPVHCPVRAHIRFHADLNHGRIDNGELQLIRYQRLLHIFLQKTDLGRTVIGYAKEAHLAGTIQNVERFRHLFRLHQRIRPVQQKHIQIFGLKPP